MRRISEQQQDPSGQQYGPDPQKLHRQLDALNQRWAETRADEDLEAFGRFYHQEIEGLVEAGDPAGTAALRLCFEDGHEVGISAGKLAAGDSEQNRELLEAVLTSELNGVVVSEALTDAYRDGRVSLEYMLSLPFTHKMAVRGTDERDHWHFLVLADSMSAGFELRNLTNDHGIAAPRRPRPY